MEDIYAMVYKNYSKFIHKLANIVYKYSLYVNNNPNKAILQMICIIWGILIVLIFAIAFG